MFAERIFDHQLVGTDNEVGTFDKQKKADRFERRDGCFRQASIQIIDDDNELVDNGGVEQRLELFSERVDLLRQVIRLLWRVLDIFPGLLGHAFQVFERQVLLRLGQQGTRRIEGTLHVVEGRRWECPLRP
jgi:hypothetical protein